MNEKLINVQHSQFNQIMESVYKRTTHAN